MDTPGAAAALEQGQARRAVPRPSAGDGWHPWVLRTGAGWADIPARYGPHQTCYDRFVRWQGDGTWERILSALQAGQEAQGRNWEASIDSSVIRAHQHAAGAPKQAVKRGSFIHRTRRSDAAAAASAPSFT